MRIQYQASAVAGAAALLLLVGGGCSASVGSDSGKVAIAPPTVGAFVLTKPNDGNQWEEGNVDQIDDGVYAVTFRSNEDRVIRPLTAIAPFPSKSASVKVGDKVVAEWVADSYYSGVVAAVGTDSATITWDDGSAPSDVSLLRITTTYK